MTKDDLRVRLREAETTEERRSLLDAYRLHVIRTTTVRERYKQMDRFLRVLSSISRGFTQTEAEAHTKLFKKRSIATGKLYDV